MNGYMPAGWNTCHESVTRADDDEPCGKVAVGYRIDEEENYPYPVCARHHRWPYADQWMQAAGDRDRARAIAATLEQKNAHLESENAFLRHVVTGEVNFRAVKSDA